MKYSQSLPFLATLSDRYRLNGEGSTKETWHIAIDISGSGLVYRPGDTLGVVPKNPITLVERFLRYLKRDGTSRVIDPRTGQEYSLFQWLHQRVDLSVLSERLFQKSIAHAVESREAQDVQQIVASYHNAMAAGVNLRENSWYRSIDVPSFFENHVPSGVDFQNILAAFTPITARFYSIASSPITRPNHVELIIRRVEYSTEHGGRIGIGSHYLTKECGKNDIRVFLQPTRQFTIPEPVLQRERPLIMVGPGTGVAPFRSFIQHMHALHENDSMHDTLWLFFGERHSAHDFFYKEYWDHVSQQNIITFDPVFSRDTTEKEYVQNRMWAKKERVFQWVHRDGGYVYVCGDAKNMAKDVENMLLHIAISEGKMDGADARSWLQNLRKQGRYRREVY